MDNQLQKLINKLSEIVEIIFNVINNNENIDVENKNKLKYTLSKYEEIFYLILNNDVDNGYSLTF